jgi:hypothetical protein
MSRKHLKGEPHMIDDHRWWYEENGGITIVCEPHVTTQVMKIPWREIRAALARKDK